MTATVHQFKDENAPRQPVTPVMDDGDGGDTHMPHMNERLAKVEGIVEGLGRTQEFTLVAVIGVGAIIAAFVIGFGIYSLQRIDVLNDKVNALPSQINSDLRDLTKTLADVIIATKQAQQSPPTPQTPPQPPPQQPKH
jgi:hypothetical protein